MPAFPACSTPRTGLQEAAKFVTPTTYTKNGLKAAKFVTLTAVQRATLPHALAGRDILGAAKTGSGKTLAFLIPVRDLCGLLCCAVCVRACRGMGTDRT
eukprot:1156865-Pelagomonas_calceolata.AAC.1